VGDRELLGRAVRAIWVDWAAEQPDPTPSWLLGWDELDDGQREVDMRIGAGVEAVVRDEIAARLTALTGFLADGLWDFMDRHALSPGAGMVPVILAVASEIRQTDG